MEIVDVLLQAPLGSGGELTSFYVENLGLEHESAGEIVAIRIGSSHLAFAPTDVARAEPSITSLCSFRVIVSRRHTIGWEKGRGCCLILRRGMWYSISISGTPSRATASIPSAT